MPIGRVVVPAFRNTGETWELITQGLGTAGVQPGGEFKKHNPGCDCCGCQCENAFIPIDVSGLVECLTFFGNFSLHNVLQPHSFNPPSGTCQLAEEPNCWFSQQFSVPVDGSVWYWEIGLNEQDRETLGWIFTLRLTNQANSQIAYWIGSLPGGRIPYTGPLKGLVFDETQLTQCGGVGAAPCVLSVFEFVGGPADCSPTIDCVTLCPGQFLLTADGVENDFCDVCEHANGDFVLDRGEDFSTNFGCEGIGGCEEFLGSSDPFERCCRWYYEFPDSSRCIDVNLFTDPPTHPFWDFWIARRNGEWQAIIGLAHHLDFAFWTKPQTFNGDCTEIDITFGPDDMCSEQHIPLFCFYHNATIRVRAILPP